MSEDLKYNLYNPGDCIPEQTMFDYIDGRLSAKEQHAVEKHMIDCELCSDALEGLRLVKNRGRIAEINRAVRERIAVPEKKTRLIDLRIVVSVAAGLLLLTGGVFFFRQFADKEEKMAALKEAPNSTIQQPEEKVQTEPDFTEEAPALDKNLSKAKEAISGKSQSGETILQEQDANGAGAVSPGASDALVIAENEKSIRPDDDAKNAVTFSGTLSGNASTGYSTTTSAPAPAASTDKKAAAKDNDKSGDEMLKTIEVADVVNADVKDEEAGNKQKVAAKRDENRAVLAERKKTEESKNAEDKPAAASANEGLAKEMPDNALEPAADSTLALSNSTAENKVYSVVDEMPKFPGGEAEMMKYIRKNLKYPAMEQETNVRGKVYVQFVVDKKGNIKDPKIFKGTGSAFDQEVVRVFKNMPKWSPGKIKGEPVDVLINFPVEVLIK